MVGAPIILVNRVGEELKFVADGQHYVLQPGDNYGFVQGHAYFAMAQNPLMGSEDYYTLEFKSFVGVKGQTPCDPLSDEELLIGMDCLERFDRGSAGLRPAERVKPRYRMPKGRTGEVVSAANENAMAIGGN